MIELYTDQCPLCGSTGELLGPLAKLAWFRCRGCGYIFCEFCNPDEVEMALLERKYAND